jgi:uncharacterized cofD-like protein
MDTPKKIVVVGGGTGTYTLLRGLKHYVPRVQLTAIVTMADSGGSTGRLRDQFGYLPVGDVRQALAALAPEDDAHQELLRQLFLYRYEKGEGLEGHNFGNLLLTALTDITGSEVAAIGAAAKLLRVAGAVVPVTTEPADLVARYDTGLEVVGEHAIDEQTVCPGEQITTLTLRPRVALNPDAAAALAAADCIVFGPGDLYTSILANCVVDGFAAAVAASAAKRVYVLNLMGKACQTEHLDAAGHVAELERYVGCALTHIIVPAAAPAPALVARYAAEGDTYIAPTLGNDQRVVRGDIIAASAIAPQPGDTLTRSYIRHDGAALAALLYRCATSE